MYTRTHTNALTHNVYGLSQYTIITYLTRPVELGKGGCIVDAGFWLLPEVAAMLGETSRSTSERMPASRQSAVTGKSLLALSSS